MGKCSKDKRDIYYRRAKQEGYRARSAFKLIQLDDKFHLLKGVSRVVDLCAAPGGWSQVLATRMCHNKNSTNQKPVIIAVDLMEMAPLEDVDMIKGDITHQKTADEIISRFSGEKAQLVVSDGAPDVLGLHDLDEYLQAQLVHAALGISFRILEKGGTFVAKVFRGRDIGLLFKHLQQYFTTVTCAKPQASRNSSFESFVVCQGFTYEDNMNGDRSMAMPRAATFRRSIDQQLMISCNHNVLFVGCPDILGFDADQSYPLDLKDEEMYASTSVSGQYVHQEPLQKPINPPYAQALRNKL